VPKHKFCDWISNNSPNNQVTTKCRCRLAKTAALPAYDALTRAHNTGTFSAKGKPTCWKEFEEANASILGSLANLDKDEKTNKENLDGIEQFVCQYEQTPS